MDCCKKDTKFFATPLEAYKDGPREKLLYVTCVSADGKSPDYLAVVDADPNSSTYSKVKKKSARLPYTGRAAL